MSKPTNTTATKLQAAQEALAQVRKMNRELIVRNSMLADKASHLESEVKRIVRLHDALATNQQQPEPQQEVRVKIPMNVTQISLDRAAFSMIRDLMDQALGDGE